MFVFYLIFNEFIQKFSRQYEWSFHYSKMISNKKKFSTFDLGQILSGNNAVLALKFDNYSIVKDMIEKLKNEIIGLNLRIEGDFVVQRPKEEIKVHKLPPSSKFGSIQALTEWSAYHIFPDFQKELGTIAANDDTIILNINHCVSDGKYIAGVAHHIGDKPQKITDSYLPITFDEEFAEELKIRSKSPPKYFGANPNNTIFSNLGMKKIDKEIMYESIYDTKTFSNYDPQKKACSNLTASIVAGYSLSVAALQNEETIFHLGGSMAATMRNVLRDKRSHKIHNIITDQISTQNQIPLNQDPITLRHSNIFTVLPMTASVTPYTKISECYRRLNKTLKDHFNLNKSDLFDFRDSMNHPKGESYNNSLMICFSNLGPLKVKKPAVDAYLYNMAFRQPASFGIMLLTYAVIDEEKDRNELHSQVRYGGNGLTEKQSMMLSKSFEHYLKNVDQNRTVGEMFNELKAFQKTLQ